MAVSEEDVRHVAALARLGLSQPQVASLVGELNGILEHMDVLQQVDIGDASRDPDATHGMRMRADVSNPIALHRERDAFAPSMRDGFFLVPRLSTHGSSESADDEAEG